jgi:hypothetical protein
MMKGRKDRRGEGKGKPPARCPEAIAAAPVTDLGDIMTHFHEALALLVVCQRSMIENDGVVHDAVHEEIVIRTAIAKFRDVYEEIDLADYRIRASQPD